MFSLWFWFFLIPALLAPCTRGPLRAGDQGAAAQGECGVLEKDRKEAGRGRKKPSRVGRRRREGLWSCHEAVSGAPSVWQEQGVTSGALALRELGPVAGR